MGEVDYRRGWRMAQEYNRDRRAPARGLNSRMGSMVLFLYGSGALFAAIFGVYEQGWPLVLAWGAVAWGIAAFGLISLPSAVLLWRRADRLDREQGEEFRAKWKGME